MSVAAVVRDADVADVPAIAAIWHAAWHDGHLGHVPEGLLVHRGPDQFAHRAAARVPETRVAVVDGRIVGL